MNQENSRINKNQLKKHVIDGLLHNKNKNKCIEPLSITVIFSEKISKIV